MSDIAMIIPTLNEEKMLPRLLKAARAADPTKLKRIVVADGGSSDRTIEIARTFNIEVVHADRSNRALQMNIGAEICKEHILYFIHADCLPPNGFEMNILNAVQKGKTCGCFRLKLESSNRLASICNWSTRLPFLWCRGGDQSLFLTRPIWEDIGPFPEIEIMEEYPIWEQILRRNLNFCLINRPILASSRKYNDNSFFEVQWANLQAFRMYRKGKDFVEIKNKYHQLLSKT
jgi:rSAM/selenodomain-associated transferase 2